MNTKKQFTETEVKQDSKIGRFFPWLYYAKDKDLGNRWFPTQIHKIRDGLAILEIAQFFNECGYLYGGSILNIPKPVWSLLEPTKRVRKVPLSLSSADVVFIPTRPPLDDEVKGPGKSEGKTKSRKQIWRSGTQLESSIFEKLRLVFKMCSRDKILLRDDLIIGTPENPQSEKYKGIKFHQYNGGTVERFVGKTWPLPKASNLAVGYLVSISDLAPGGFQVIASFSAGGTETLWFNYHLRTAHRDRLVQALTRKGIHVSIFPFLVPDYAPTLLSCNPRELEARCEWGSYLEWSYRQGQSNERQIAEGDRSSRCGVYTRTSTPLSRRHGYL